MVEDACHDARFVVSLPSPKHLPFSNEQDVFIWRSQKKGGVICVQKFTAEILIRGTKPASPGHFIKNN